MEFFPRGAAGQIAQRLRSTPLLLSVWLQAPSALVAQAVAVDTLARAQPDLDAHAALQVRLDSELGDGWLRRAQDIRNANALALTHRDPESIEPLRGVYKMLVLPGTYSDVVPAYPAARYDSAYFGRVGVEGRYSLSEWYSEVSGGLFTFEGETAEWIRLDRTKSYYVNDYTNNGRGRWIQYIGDVLYRANMLVDWSRYDNDGPDGIPDSGDDDGFVDMVAFMTPLGDRCTDDLRGLTATGFRLSAIFDTPFLTTQTGANGEPLQVERYIFVDGLFCPNGGSAYSTIASMDTPIHEMGHALDLPDLYDYDGSSYGVGSWDVMGLAGWWSPDGRPSQFGAWARTSLGWTEVESARHGASYTLQPVEVSRQVLHIPIPQSEEYFLLENRQRIGADQPIAGTGLVVWHIDPAAGRERDWVPYNENRPAVGLVQADGRRDLARRLNWGDAGDPFPGDTEKRVFDGRTSPTTNSNLGSPSGISIVDIEEVDQNVSFRVFLADPLVVDDPQTLPSLALGREDYAANPTFAGGLPPLVWTQVGDWSDEWALTEGGTIRGIPTRLGTVVLALRVDDALGQTSSASVTVETVMPSIGETSMLDAVTDGRMLDRVRTRALDFIGNRNGRLDVGDAYLFLTRNER